MVNQEVLREKFVQNYIAAYVTNDLVVNAFRAVDRGDFKTVSGDTRRVCCTA